MNISCINCPVRTNYTLAINKQSGIIPVLSINKVANEEPYSFISETICSMCDLLRRIMERIVHVHNYLHLQTGQKAGRLVPDLLTEDGTKRRALWFSRKCFECLDLVVQKD